MERSGTNSWDTLLGVDERRSFFVDFLSKKVCEFSKRANDLVNVVNELEYRVNLRTSLIQIFIDLVLSLEYGRGL